MQGGTESKSVSMRQRNRKMKPKKRQGLFRNVPSEIAIDIISRLPVKSVIRCKCVCKPWLNLLETDEFAKSHLSRSVPGLFATNTDSWCADISFGFDFEDMIHPGMDVNEAALWKRCNFYEFKDVLHLKFHENHYVPVAEFEFGMCGLPLGSTNGLLFLHDPETSPQVVSILNPITCDYIKIPCPEEDACYYDEGFFYTYGFGVSRITGQYKVVWIFYDYTYGYGDESDEEINEARVFCPMGHVYTLGTGLWRSITPGNMLQGYDRDRFGAFVNGNLHWLVFDHPSGFPLISCFDLEDELFSTFPPPPAPLLAYGSDRRLLGLVAFEGNLCVSEYVCDKYVIWLMKDYGEKSWTKEYVIRQSRIPDFNDSYYDNDFAYPVKVFKDGHILMARSQSAVFYYSTKTKTCHDEIQIFDIDLAMKMIIHTPSFVSLKGFVNEKVCSIFDNDNSYM